MFFLNFELLSCFKLSTKISRKMTHSIKALYVRLNVRLSCDKRNSFVLIMDMTDSALPIFWHKTF